MVNLISFSTKAEYDEKKDSLHVPNISYIAETESIEAIQQELESTPLTFIFYGTGSLSFSGTGTNSIELSVDNGDSWHELTGTINIGYLDSIMFSGDCTPVSGEGIGQFVVEGTFQAMGNITSLLDGNEMSSGDTYAFMNIFKNCTGLTRANKLVLPSEILSEYCFAGMFEGCSNLTVVPELLTETPSEGCYNRMFYGCSKLSYIKCLTVGSTPTGYTEDWVYGVAETGLFIKEYNRYDWNVGDSGLPTGWEVKDYMPHKPMTLKVLANGNVKFAGTTSSCKLNYSTDDGRNWNELPNNTDVQVTSGQSIMFSGECSPNINGIGRFYSSSSDYEVEGNVMSLLFGDGFKENYSLSGKDYVFVNLFSGCTGLTSSENLVLPATTLSIRCYYFIFKACSRMRMPPKVLPALETAQECYRDMFNDCSGLTETPNVLATTMAVSACTGMYKRCVNLVKTYDLHSTTLSEGCYGNTYGECRSLVKAPELPATTLANICYQGMFTGCTSLTTAPSVLPATTLVSNCYEAMFQGCTSLTTAPSLPATTLAQRCYLNMFNGCTSLTTAPSLPATTLDNKCYYGMFSGCTNLNSITCLATNISASYCTYYWVSGVAQTGTFTKDPSMTSWTTGNNGIPTNWTVEDAT